MEVRAVRGRAMVAGVPLAVDVPGGRCWNLPPDLVEALQEWARVAAGGPRDPTQRTAVSRRGRHLAARLSVVLAAPVDYCDPVNGHRIALRAVTRTPHPPPVALPARGSPAGSRVRGATPAAGAGPAGGAGREPTPWASGVTMAVLTAGLVLLADLALAGPIVERLGVLGLVIDVAVAAGLVPALWLNRRVPTWRWAVYGTVAGMALAVPFLAATALTAA